MILLCLLFYRYVLAEGDAKGSICSVGFKCEDFCERPALLRKSDKCRDEGVEKFKVCNAQCSSFACTLGCRQKLTEKIALCPCAYQAYETLMNSTVALESGWNDAMTPYQTVIDHLKDIRFSRTELMLEQDKVEFLEGKILELASNFSLQSMKLEEVKKDTNETKEAIKNFEVQTNLMFNQLELLQAELLVKDDTIKYLETKMIEFFQNTSRLIDSEKKISALEKKINDLPVDQFALSIGGVFGGAGFYFGDDRQISSGGPRDYQSTSDIKKVVELMAMGVKEVNFKTYYSHSHTINVRGWQLVYSYSGGGHLKIRSRDGIHKFRATLQNISPSSGAILYESKNVTSVTDDIFEKFEKMEERSGGLYYRYNIEVL